MQISFVLHLKPELINGVINSGRTVENIFAASMDYLFQGINPLNVACSITYSNGACIPKLKKKKPLTTELNCIFHLLALLRARPIVHVSRKMVKDGDENTIPEGPVIIILC